MAPSRIERISRRHFIGTSAAFASLAAGRARGADAPAALAALSTRITGDILLPSAPAYDDARRTFSFNPRTSAHPLAIIRCKTEEDIRRGLEFTRDSSLPLAVRSGGHDVLGASTVEGGVILDLAGFDAITPDLQAGLVRVGGGVRAGTITKTLGETGHAVALGCNPAVGVSGLTLGGGIGWLLGTSGAACDNLLSVRLLTADGRFVNASAEEEPDLFWGLKGGGGNFGIATEFNLRLRNLPKVVGGHIAYPGELLREFLELYREEMAKAPPELVVEALIMSPSRPVIFAIICFAGDPSAADAVLAPWRRFGPPLADSIGLKPFADFDRATPEVAKFFQGPQPDPAFKNKRPDIYWMGGSIASLDDVAIAAMVDAAKAAPPNWDISLGHHMHGAISEGAPGETAFIRRPGAMTYHFDCYWFDPGKAEASMAWVDQSVAAMKRHAGMPTYINYLGSNAPVDVESAYGAGYARLSRIKRRFDPANLFHRNRNIEPA